MDPVTKAPFIVLRDIEGTQTHDLLKNIMDQTESKVTKVEICDIRDNTFYALICLTNRGESLAIDSWPSDAIALAIRAQAPIFVSDEVLRKSKQIVEIKESVSGDKTEQRESLRDMLEKLKPEDLSKYKVWSYSFNVRPQACTPKG